MTAKDCPTKVPERYGWRLFAGLVVSLACWSLILGSLAAYATNTYVLADTPPHNEQGDFTISCPDASLAESIATWAGMAGVPCTTVNPTTVVVKIEGDVARAWWCDLRPRLTTCIISAGAEGRGTAYSLSAGAEG